MELEKLLLAPRSREMLNLFVKEPSHALIISGPNGSGKKSIVKALSQDILAVSSLANYPFFISVNRLNGKKEIAIDQVREAIAALKLKTYGSSPIRRIIYFQEAHFLSTEAQNALLKVLEEPAKDTILIMSLTSADAVLPTIRSRAMLIPVAAVDLDQAKSYFGSISDQVSLASAWQLSQGRVGLMTALLNQSDDHPLRQAVDLAKQILKQTPYERLLSIGELSRDKERFNIVLEALDRILSALQHSAIEKDQAPQRFIGSRKLVAKIEESLEANVSPRLAALELALNLMS